MLKLQCKRNNEKVFRREFENLIIWLVIRNSTWMHQHLFGHNTVEHTWKDSYMHWFVFHCIPSHLWWRLRWPWLCPNYSFCSHPNHDVYLSITQATFGQIYFTNTKSIRICVLPSGHNNSKSSLSVFLAHHSRLLPPVFSLTVVCLTKATWPPPSTKQRNAPVWP